MVSETRKIQVVIGEAKIPVGELIYEKRDLREAASFRYDQAWLENPNAFALSPSMPLGDAPYWGSSKDGGTVLPAPIADGTPDSWGRALIRAAKPHATELDYLIGSDDFTRLGALRYLDEEGVPQAERKRDSIPKLVDLAEIAAAARSFEAEPTQYAALRANLIGAAGSLGGARPKVNVEGDSGLWIAKLTSERDIYPVEKAEVAVLTMAQNVGITVAKAELLNDRATLPVALIERFDRHGSGRLAYISAQTFLGLEGTEPATYVDIADAMRQHGSRPIEDMRELLGRMMFTVFVSNYDDHLRNHGFLYDRDNRWRLAPMFDVNPEPERGQNLKTAVSEIHGNEASIEAVIDAAPFFEVQQDEAAVMAREMADEISSSWRHIAAHYGMSAAEVKRFAPAFEHDEIDAARRLGQLHTASADPAEIDPVLLDAASDLWSRETGPITDRAKSLEADVLLGRVGNTAFEAGLESIELELEEARTHCRSELRNLVMGRDGAGDAAEQRQLVRSISEAVFVDTDGIQRLKARKDTPELDTSGKPDTEVQRSSGPDV